MEPIKKLPRLKSNKDNTNEGSQSNCRSLIALPGQIEFYFNNEVMADFHFCVGHGDTKVKIPAHKFVLGSRSPVFYALFYGPLATKDAELEIPDVEPSIFLLLLKFLYSGKTCINRQSVVPTWYAAKKYAVAALEADCIKFLEEKLDSDNAFEIYKQAQQFDEPLLEVKCLAYIDENTADIINAGSFTDIDNETLCLFLERNLLMAVEFRLFQAVIKWGKAECRRKNLEINRENMRLSLGRALNLIRFPLMTVEQFASEVAESNILTDSETIEMFLYFTKKPRPAVRFSAIPRSYSSVSYEVSRFQCRESGWDHLGVTDRIGITVNRPIFLVGLGFYGAIQGAANYSVSFMIHLKVSKKILGRKIAIHTCKGDEYTFRVDFDSPIPIPANTEVMASTKILGPESFYGFKGLKHVSVGSGSGLVKFQFSRFDDPNMDTNVETGQIPLIYYRL